MMTDTLADMFTRIRNANMAGLQTVDFPASKLKANVCKVLKEEGFIKSFKIIAKTKSDITIKIFLKPGGIAGIKRVSKPGLRVYSDKNSMPRVLSGLGTSIISTPKGVLSTRSAKQKGVGGEVLCNVW